MSKSKWLILLTVLMVAAFALAACATPTPETITETIIETVVVTQEVEVVETVTVEKEVTVIETQIVEVEKPSDRKGGWLDTIVMIAEPSAQSAVTRIVAGDIDVYADDSSDSELYASLAPSGLQAFNNFGLSDELTFNPYGPVFDGTGKINPFSSTAVRNAMNMLIDRSYIVQEIYGGLAVAKYFPVVSGFPDYARYIDVVREVEAANKFDPVKAEEIITAEMEALGATKNADGKWTDPSDGSPVTLVFLIRTEDKRRDIGDYISNVLEGIGFTVDRQYKTSSEASVLWVRGNVADGLWHLYTGAWITTAIDRDAGSNFEFYYSNRSAYSFTTLWQSYAITEETADLYTRLANNDFTTLEERKELFGQAMRSGVADSHRLWLVDRLSFFPYSGDVEIAGDLAGGLSGSQLGPYTLRFEGQEGGELVWAMGDLLVEPWNPIAGSNWIFDNSAIRFTDDPAVIANPYTGLAMPNHLESATVVVKEGLPVGQTLDWVDFSFAAEIEVPGDAWADWDAVNQTWITVAEKFPEGATANVKSTVVYPADFFETHTWHDGSPVSAGDFVLPLIMGFDVAKEGSAIYDEAQAGNLESFLSAFKGYRVVSTAPLTLEFYSDAYSLDAENNVVTFWPNYGYGTAPWHSMALGYLADAAGELAFSADKADGAEIEWMSFIDGPSLDILDAKLDQAIAEGFIPYANVMGQFISAEEAAARYANMNSWKATQGHFWVGTGPYYLNKVFSVEKTLTLTRYQDYPYASNKWAGFGVAPLSVVEIDGAGKVGIGSEASFDVYVDLGENPYPAADIAEVKFLVFDATGALAATGNAEAVEDGLYTVSLSADITSKLAAGANKLEVAVVSKIVSVPSFATFEFVTE